MCMYLYMYNSYICLIYVVHVYMCVYIYTCTYYNYIYITVARGSSKVNIFCIESNEGVCVYRYLCIKLVTDAVIYIRG